MHRQYNKKRSKKLFKGNKQEGVKEPTLASTPLDETIYTDAIIENVLLDSLPKGTEVDVSALASKVYSGLKEAQVDLDNDGIISQSEFELNMRSKRETFDRYMVIVSLGGAIVITLLIIILAAIYPDLGGVFSGLSGILIASVTGLLAVVGAFVGIKTVMNGREDLMANANYNSQQEDLGLNQRG